MAFFTYILLLLFCSCVVEGDILDPCMDGFYADLNTDKLGSRNEHCPMGSAHNTVCDHYLKDDWYAVKDALMLDHCPKTGDCGVLYPIWMQGTHPKLADGIVNRTVCIKKFGNCCYERMNIEIKSCTNFFVYHLLHAPTCPTAYCFDSKLPCFKTTTTSTSVMPTGANVTPVKPVLPDEPDEECDSKCILIIIAVLVAVVLCMTILISVVVFLKYCKQRRPTVTTFEHICGQPLDCKQGRPTFTTVEQICGQPPEYSQYDVHIPAKK